VRGDINNSKNCSQATFFWFERGSFADHKTVLYLIKQKDPARTEEYVKTKITHSQHSHL